MISCFFPCVCVSHKFALFGLISKMGGKDSLEVHGKEVGKTQKEVREGEL